MFHFRQIPKTGSAAIKLTVAIVVVFIIIFFAVICFYKRKRKYFNNVLKRFSVYDELTNATIRKW